MKIEKKTNYTLIHADENAIGDFIDKLNLELEKSDTENVIITFSKEINRKKEDFLLFLDTAVQRKELGTSFVLVYKDINADDYPENFNIVPTVLEAEDILDMEAMERELGF